MSLPVPRQTLEEMERNRGRALDLFGEAFDRLDEARKFAALAAGSGAEKLELDDDTRNLIMPYRYGSAPQAGREKFLEGVTRLTDRAMWSHVIAATDLERLMDKQARDEFRTSLHASPPPATVQNVQATLSHMLESADDIFRRGIANAFSALDRRFRSHDGFKIGARVVLPWALNEHGGWAYGAKHEETVRDIERTFCILEGDQAPGFTGSAVRQIEQASRDSSRWRIQPFTIETEYFRVRGFINRNIHLWFKRDDLLRKVNRLLADYYGETIGEGSDVADVADMGPSYHITPARNFGLFETSEETAQRVFERLGSIEPGARLLEPSAGRGALAKIARSKGANVQCVEIQTGLSAELREQGLAVKQADFLTLTPADLGMFDAIVMNPPFDRGRDCDHVRHALTFLKPGCRLVAIMSARSEFAEDKRTASFRALIDKFEMIDRWARSKWQDLPAGSFAHAGTMVNTVTLAIRKPA